MNAIMYITTTQAVVVFCLICFAYWLCQIFKREVDPMRRRDLALASADDPDSAEERIRGAASRMFLLVVVLLLVDIALMLFGLKSMQRTGTYPRIMSGFIYVTTPLIPLIPICHCIIATFARRACLTNRPLHPAAMGVAVIIALACVLIVPGAIVIGVDFALHTSLKAPQWAKDCIGITLVVGAMFTSCYMVFFFPMRAHNKLLEAYRYSE